MDGVFEKALTEAAADELSRKGETANARPRPGDEPETLHLLNEDREENGQFAPKDTGDRTGGSRPENTALSGRDACMPTFPVRRRR